ncbi:MAG: DUF92 domain-containing protein [Pyrobaculum sp.]
MDLYFVTIPSIALLALLALRRRYLTPRGTVVAVAVGSAVALAHTGLFVLMALFFVSSSALTRLRAEWKKAMGLKDVSGRSLRQVFGVGTPIALYALLYVATGRQEFLGAAAVSTAVATADTWASEVGVAYGGVPRYVIAPWRRVEPGVSGGVTLVGMLSSLAGAVFIGASAQALGVAAPFWLVAALGYLGELLDSVVGALLQVKYVCGGRIYETPLPGCMKKGLVSNEAVNLISGLAAGALYIYLS